MLAVAGQTDAFDEVAAACQGFSERPHIPRAAGEAMQQEHRVVAASQLEGRRFLGIHLHGEHGQ